MLNKTALTLTLALLLAVPACGGGGGGGSAPVGTDPMPGDEGGGAPPPIPPIEALSDEFDDPATLVNWQRVYAVEGWGFDQLETLDIDTTEPGALTLMPYTSAWFEEWRGVLVFKEVTGDFVVTAQVRVSNRADTGPPASLYSLAGIMARAPRAITPATWNEDGENYVFHSMGAASVPGTWQTEVKTTIDSTSILEINPGGPIATLRSARIGPHMILLLRWPGQAWAVHRRYRRDAFPATLQVGITTYTDWDNCQSVGYPFHNTNLLLGGTPDLIARVDYLRFVEPQVPAPLLGLDLSNAAVVSDADLLGFLGFD